MLLNNMFKNTRKAIILILLAGCAMQSACSQKVPSRFTVITDPPNAQIFSDGEFVGVSPVDIRCTRDIASSPGGAAKIYSPHEVKAIKKGYHKGIKILRTLDDVDAIGDTDSLFKVFKGSSPTNILASSNIGKTRFPIIRMSLSRIDSPASVNQDQQKSYTASPGNTQGATPPAEHDTIRRELSLGDYYALVIGNSDYAHLNNLKTAENDARSISHTLENKYGFRTRNLYNADRSQIIMALNEYRKNLTAKDNLLIYYAGHGIIDQETNVGFWLPSNAHMDNPANWLSNSTLTNMIRGIPAKHIFIISDSCFSGTLTRGVRAIPKNSKPNLKYWQRISNKRARVVLTSGGLEPVSDSGSTVGSEHSVFAEALLSVLKDNGHLLNSSQLSAKVRKKVIINADQTPEYADIRLTGHDGGDFIFVSLHE